MRSLARKGLAAIGLAALILMVPIQAAMAGSGIDTTRPLSDAGFRVQQRSTVTTMRPLSDSAFGVRAAFYEGVPDVTRRALSDAGFDPLGGAGTRPAPEEVPAPSASTSRPVWVLATIALAGLLAAMSIVMLERRRHPLRTT
jgi:hypothetical protein